jgi:anthranilate phosphoribosyltransferase
MGASLVLELTGEVANPVEGVQMAADTIDSGRAGRFLEEFRRYFAG